MNDEIKPIEPPARNVTWHTVRRRAHCEHEFEVIAHDVGGALKRCLKCRSLEES